MKGNHSHKYTKRKNSEKKSRSQVVQVYRINTSTAISNNNNSYNAYINRYATLQLMKVKHKKKILKAAREKGTLIVDEQINKYTRLFVRNNANSKTILQ